MMVHDSDTKMTSFRSAIRAFKMTESTAQNMIDTIYNVLDRDNQATISVVKHVGQIFEEDGDRDKARNILEAINGFRAQVSLIIYNPLAIRVKLISGISKNSSSHRLGDQVALAVTSHTLPLVKSCVRKTRLTHRAVRPTLEQCGIG